MAKLLKRVFEYFWPRPGLPGWEAVCAWWWGSQVPWEKDRERWRELYGPARQYKPVVWIGDASDRRGAEWNILSKTEGKKILKMRGK